MSRPNVKEASHILHNGNHNVSRQEVQIWLKHLSHLKFCNIEQMDIERVLMGMLKEDENVVT